MTPQHIPVPEHDLTRTAYSPHSSDFGVALVFDDRCRRCWYEKAKAEDAPLLAATKAALKASHDPVVKRILMAAIALAKGRTA